MKRMTVSLMTILGVALTAPNVWANDGKSINVETVSTHAELVSGGDVLLRVTVSEGIDLGGVSVRINDRDVTGAFQEVDAALLGLVDGLREGHNVAAAQAPLGGGFSGTDTQLILNHPITGPVFSGPHQQPWICETEAFDLGPALDEDCSANTRVSYLYRSTVTNSFEPFDPGAPPPPDLAQTTTIDGLTVDYIVRHEVGTINRAIYEIAVLTDPAAGDPMPFGSNAPWNGKLVYGFGGGCNAGYHQGRGTGGVLNNNELSRGYAVASATTNVLQNNCNAVLSAETAAMVKEHFIETYGPVGHTIGRGGSGGAIQQHEIGQNYPDVLDGLIVGASFPDSYTVGIGVVDCGLLGNYFNNNSLQVWTHEQKTAVSGFATFNTCNSWSGSFLPTTKPSIGCDPSVPPELIYDPETNPDGVRCTVPDNAVNVWGIDPKTGFARSTYDNTGVQYGAEALQDGLITPEQFVELNERIGGVDPDGDPAPERNAAGQKALRIAYRTGRVNSGTGGLRTTPIIDTRRYTDPFADIHDRFRSILVRHRLDAANGTHENQVIVMRSITGAGGIDELGQMEQWLQNIAADTATQDPQERVIINRPADLNDVCFDFVGTAFEEEFTFDGPGVCNALFPNHAEPRTAAGAPVANDILKCQLKHFDANDYGPDFSDEQLAGLATVFEKGVCDWTQPGVAQTGIAGTYLHY
jgi:hypothetical protein